jgi:HNH endonuclease
MREIRLTQGKVALVDDADFERVSRYKWSAWWSGWNWYATTHKPRPSHERIYMHRFIIDAPKGIKVDHKDRDGLNNQRENIRLATNPQNSQNTGLSLANTSGYKGVARFREKWQAGIKVNYHRIHLGHFNTAEEAARAYDSKARELFGEFAKTNF